MGETSVRNQSIAEPIPMHCPAINLAVLRGFRHFRNSIRKYVCARMKYASPVTTQRTSRQQWSDGGGKKNSFYGDLLSRASQAPARRRRDVDAKLMVIQANGETTVTNRIPHLIEIPTKKEAAPAVAVPYRVDMADLPQNRPRWSPSPRD